MEMQCVWCAEIEIWYGMEHGLGVGVTVLHIHIETAIGMNMLRAAINAQL